MEEVMIFGNMDIGHMEVKLLIIALNYQLELIMLMKDFMNGGILREI